ncbi:MAG: YraN family protein [bacterium]|nr:MAG: YraN family protein [bacterium]
MLCWKRKPPHLILGERGERLAARHLRLRGYRIMARNFKCPLGEIDIIASKRSVLVFVEVRTRQEPWLACPIDTVDGYKTARLVNAARYYLMVNRIEGIPCRFDILGLSLPQGKGRARVVHIRNAFALSDRAVEQARRNWFRRLYGRFPRKKRSNILNPKSKVQNPR